MEKPKRLIGYLNYDDTSYPFVFDDKDFLITLFPPTLEKWDKTSTIRHQFEVLTQYDSKKHEWIKEIKLCGITSERNHIIFCVRDSVIDYNGFPQYPVNWYFYFRDPLTADTIDGFRLSGDTINYFFPPYQATASQIEYGKDKYSIKKMQVTTKPPVIKSCGKYRIIKHIDAAMEVQAYASLNFYNASPMSSTSIFVTSFSESVKLDTLVRAFIFARCFFKYITYRENVCLDTIEVFDYDTNHKHCYDGLLVMKSIGENESHKKAKDRIIDYNLIGIHTGDIFTDIKNGKIGFRHLCKSIEDRKHYDAGRFVMILAEFERQFYGICGQDADRSDIYKEVKQDVVKHLLAHANTYNGKKRQEAKKIAKSVEKMDSSFATRVNMALSMCEDIMGPFIKHSYHGTYSSASKEISGRMGEVRNSLAHSRLDFEFDAIHITDIKVIEKLTYALRMKKRRIKSRNIQKGIDHLFGEMIVP